MGAALELSLRESRGANRKLEVVLELIGRRPVATPGVAVALPALGLHVELLAAGQELRRGGRRGREHERRPPPLPPPPPGERPGGCGERERVFFGGPHP